MPVYVYSCPVCARKREIVKPISLLDRPEHCQHCNFAMNRQICAPAVRGDYPPYECPVTGKIIEGRAAHEENLRRTGCRLLEPGEVENTKRRRTDEENSFLESVGTTVEAEIHSMQPRQREKLIAEIEGGLDVGITRSTPSAGA